jgi:MinD superfamily P-loop ATPase
MSRGDDWLIADGPPGLGCPVIAAITGADLALFVTEPSVSGAHDLERTLDLADHFRVPAMVVINKADISTGQADSIASTCTQRSVPLVGRVPFDTTVTDAMVQGQPITSYSPDCAVSAELGRVWRAIQERFAG